MSRQRIKMQLGMVIGVCARDLGIDYLSVTAHALHAWAQRPKNRKLFDNPPTLEQAQYIIDHPTELAETIDDPKENKR